MTSESRISTKTTTDQPPAKPSDYLPTLDGWRAIAVLSVVISHFPAPKNAWNHPYGIIGVQLFFGISGFLICYRLLEERKSKGKISVKGFYIRRCFRIMPAAVVYLAVVSLLMAASILPPDWAGVVGSLAYVRNYYPTGGGFYTTHFWSLAVEEHFYLFFPFLLILLRSKAEYFIPALALTVAVHRFLDKRYLYFGDQFPGAGIMFHTDHCLDGLLLGAAAALWMHPRPGLFKGKWWAISVFPCLLILYSQTGKFGTFLPPVIVRASIAAYVIAVTVRNPDYIFGKILEIKVLRVLGRLSYSIYLWQQLFFVFTTENMSESMHPLQQCPFSIISAAAMATMSYYFVEKPMVKIGHRLSKSPPPIR